MERYKMPLAQLDYTGNENIDRAIIMQRMLENAGSTDIVQVLQCDNRFNGIRISRYEDVPKPIAYFVNSWA